MLQVGSNQFGLNLSVTTLAIDPVNPQTLYAGAQGLTTGLYKTTGGGATWRLSNAGLPFTLFNGNRFFINLSQLAVDPSLPSTVYVATASGGFFRSTDGGANWSLARNGLNNLIVTGLGVAPSGKVLLGTNPGSDALLARVNANGTAFTLMRLLGGAESDEARSVALDAAGNIHLFGTTFSFDFPTVNPLQNKNQATFDFLSGSDAFVTKLNPAGTETLYSSYLGGGGGEQARALALDAAGNWYLAGNTSSNNFPVTPGAYKTAKAEGDNDGFVAKLNAAGTALVFSTLLGGGSVDSLAGLAVDRGGQVDVTGQTISLDFPSVNAWQGPGTPNGFFTNDAFFSKLSADGSSLLFSSFLGGLNNEAGNGVAVDARRNVYLTGSTNSSDFPMLNPLQPAAAQFGSVSDAFLTKLTPQADLAVTSAADHNPVLENNSYTYRATVTNHGPDEALDVTLTDRVPDGVTNVTIAASTGAGVCTGNPVVTCRFGELAAGASVRLTIAATAPAATASALTQRATVASPTNDPVTANNTVALSTRLTTAPSVAGRVRLSNGAPLPGVSISITTAPNPPVAQTTNAQGTYQYAELMRGANVTLRPRRAGYSFAPGEFTTTKLQRDVTADFTATPGRFALAANQQNFPMQGGRAEITVTANCPWQARSNVPWITLNKASGLTGDLIIATVAAGNTARSGVITVSDGVNTAALTLQQEFASCATPNFRIARVLPTTALGTGLSEGDFNGDGNADLVQFNGSNGATLVSLGDGKGGFAAPAPVTVGTITGAPAFSFTPYLLTGDLNNDGRSDLVIASGNASGSTATDVITIVLANANGTFAAPRTITLTALPARLWLTRLNNDTRLDLLIQVNNTLTSWLGAGDGSFTVAGAGQQLFFNDLVAADFNRDNFADLVTLANGELLWQAGDGAGRFAAPVRILTGNFFGSLATGDFNRDGNLDVAALISAFANNQQNFSVAVVTGDGAGRFASEAQRFATDSFGGLLVARDVNNDGWLDLFYRNTRNGLTLMLGGAAPQLLRAPRHFSGSSSNGSFALSDFNRDGLLDVAVQTATGTATGMQRAQLVLLYGSGLDFVAGRSFVAPAQAGVVSGDFNNDGRTDVVQLFSPTNTTGQPSALTIAVRLSPVAEQPGNEIVSTFSLSSLAVEARDFNYDGKLDLVIREASAFSLLAGDGAGRFQSVARLAGFPLATQVNPGSAPVVFAAADFNRDGRDDFITLNASRQPVLYLSTGASGYNAPQPFGQGQNLTTFLTGDFNGDGAADIAAFQPRSTNCPSGNILTPLALLLGDGQGGFTHARATISTAPASILAEDLNGDGRTDLVAFNACNQTSLSVEYGTAAGGFTTGAFFTALGETIAALAVGDVNNDSRKDLIAIFGSTNASVSGGQLAAFVARSGSVFNEAATLGPTELANSLHVGDFTGDGRTDVLTYQTNGAYFLYSNNCITTRALALSSAASFSNARFAPDAIVAAFGDGLATATETARAVPLPLQLAGTRITVTDTTGTEHAARLYFVSPQQINFQMPPAVAIGTAQVTIINGNGVVFSGFYPIAPIAPGLFAANATGQGVAAAVLLRQRKDGIQLYEPVARFDNTANTSVAVPIDFGLESDQLFLLLYGTGLRGRSALSAVTVKVGGLAAPVLYAGPQGDLASLDQINVLLPRELKGRGEVAVVLTVDGLAANAVRIQIR